MRTLGREGLESRPPPLDRQSVKLRSATPGDEALGAGFTSSVGGTVSHINSAGNLGIP